MHGEGGDQGRNAGSALWPASRRTVLKAGALAGVAAAGGLASAAAGATSAARIRYVVADRRVAQSLVFARLLEEQGAERLDVADGLTSLWRERLLPHWRNPHGTVAGLTTVAVWDCLSQQAGDHFRKARLLGRHAVAVRATGAGLESWPGIAARDACAGLPGRERACMAYPVLPQGEPGMALVSWMIG